MGTEGREKHDDRPGRAEDEDDHPASRGLTFASPSHRPPPLNYSRRESSFDTTSSIGDYPPLSECEEIPSRRWLALLFGWEDRRLPPDYRKILQRADVPVRFSTLEELNDRLRSAILIDNGRKSFSLDRSAGKKCYMMSARDLEISFENFQSVVAWKSSSKSRFSEVAIITSVGQSRLVGKIKMMELSRETTYAAYLVFESSSRMTCRPPKYLKASVTAGDQVVSERVVPLQETTRMVPSPPFSAHTARPWTGEVGDFVVDVGEQPWLKGLPDRRSDGFMEEELGSFFVVDHSNGKGTVLVRFDVVIDDDGSEGLVVEGIDVRPTDDHGNGTGRAGVPWNLSSVKAPRFFKNEYIPGILLGAPHP